MGTNRAKAYEAYESILDAIERLYGEEWIGMCEFEDMRRHAQGENRTDLMQLLRRRMRRFLPAGLKTMDDYDEELFPDFFLSQAATRVLHIPTHPKFDEKFCLLNGTWILFYKRKQINFLDRQNGVQIWSTPRCMREMQRARYLVNDGEFKYRSRDALQCYRSLVVIQGHGIAVCWCLMKKRNRASYRIYWNTSKFEHCFTLQYSFLS